MAGVLQDFREIGERCLDLGAEYWDQDAVRALTFDGRLTVLTGDAVVSDDAATVALYCNRDLLEKNGLADPAALVEAGNWTVDALYEMCRQTASRVSDGLYMSFDPEDADVWGRVCPDWTGSAFMYAAGRAMTEKDASDRPVLRLDDAQNVAAWRKIAAMLTDAGCISVAGHYGETSAVVKNMHEIFTDGNALFMPGSLSLLETDLPGCAPFPIGILPLPKLDGR